MRKLRILYSDEDDNRIIISTEEIAEAVGAFSIQSREWKDVQAMKSPLEEMILALEEVIKKSRGARSHRGSNFRAAGPKNIRVGRCAANDQNSG